jgi:UDP-MurNAc hydroxylase
MQITFLGHAGFCVETEETIVVTDPWLSPSGAFDSAWFQYPRNHHLAAYVQEKLADSTKERYLYVSHEHKDHLDLEFLHSIRARDFTLVIPDYRRDHLVSALSRCRCKEVVVCADSNSVPVPDGELTLYLDDSELNRDSGILIEAGGRTFFDLNDCRIFDALPMIGRRHGPIDVFACQFSGAGWHPTCYDYSPERYAEIAKKKVMAKFAAVAKGVETLEPRVFIPSAGPPCFLDPTLGHLNFEAINIFPRAPRIIEFLNTRARSSATAWPDMMPGDVLDADSGTMSYAVRERVGENDHESYIRAYASCYERFFAERRLRCQEENGRAHLLERLRDALQEKLEPLTLHERVNTPLYFCLEDHRERMLRVEFPTKSVDYATGIEDRDHYAITAPSWEIARVLDGKITWDDFSLTFRLRLNREPDVYQTVVQGYLRLEPEDLRWFCARLLNIERNQERIVVEASGCRYAINRFCPHQGGDLSRGWVEEGRFLVCPRHQWRFDLEHDGRAQRTDETIDALCLDDD